MASVRREIDFPLWAVALALSPIDIGLGVLVTFMISIKQWVLLGVFVAAEIYIVAAMPLYIRTKARERRDSRAEATGQV